MSFSVASHSPIVAHVASPTILQADLAFQVVLSKVTAPDNKLAGNVLEVTTQPPESGTAANAMYGPRSIGM